MQFTILGQGFAVPEFSISAEESARYAEEYFCETDEQRRMLPMLYRMSGVKRRHSVLLEGPEGSENRHTFFLKPAGRDDMGPSLRTRMALYEKRAGALALQAARDALADADCAPESITHLITVSCSGFAAPGVDIELIKGLGLPSTTERTHVGFMGCHGALNGIRVARGLAESDPRARVLLCAVELCSIHYHYGWDPEQIVANALFADGASALVGGAAENSGGGGWHVAATGSRLVPDSEEAMTWRLGDHGFVMSLSPRVPELIGRYLRDWLAGWLSGNSLSIEDVGSWAVHPGGPRILSATAKALGLGKDALAVSKDVLADYGNMSSPTVLLIIHRLRQIEAPLPCVALAFGPGLMAEATLFV